VITPLKRSLEKNIKAKKLEFGKALCPKNFGAL
jgi:hypothetical protein